MKLALLALSLPLFANTYTTNFPLTENPISEAGMWVNGGQSPANNWTNVQTTPGLAFGTMPPSTGNDDDSTALLTGTWGPTQTVTAIVHAVGSYANGMEVEMRLRSAFGTNSCTGYELDIAAGYIAIVRWNGPLNNFTVLAQNTSATWSLPGATVTGTISGSTITIYVSGVQIVQATDSTYSTGNPGMGFFISTGGDSTKSDMGFTSFSATDSQSSTYSAATCNYSDVNTLINGPTHTAVNGDTIKIPAGSCTWSSGLVINGVCITVQGAGTPNNSPSTFSPGTLSTTITDALNDGATPLITVENLPYAGCSGPNTARISTLTIQPGGSVTNGFTPITLAGICTSGGCPNVRVDNISFPTWAESTTGVSSDWMIRSDNVFGVIDHNSVPSGTNVILLNANHSAYLGVGGFGDNSWAQPDTFGGANNLYIENNSVFVDFQTVTDCDINPVGGGIGGCRIVGRYNHITSSNGVGGFYVHGLDTDGRPQGGRQIEAYGNTMTCTTSSCNNLVTYRSGTGYVWGNTMNVTGGGFYNGIVEIPVYRTVFTNGPFGACGGSGPWDTNDGVTYYSGTNSTAGTTLTDSSKAWTSNQFIPSGAPYSVRDVTQGWWAEIASNTSDTLTIAASIPEQTNTFAMGDSYQILRATVCMDQGGRGQGIYISGSGTPTPSGAINQALDPIYEWMDTNQLEFDGNVIPGTLRLIANRDWYTDNSAGAQSSPTSPFNGATGMGWGTKARRPTTCTPSVGYWATDEGNWNQSGIGGQGNLYTCASTNTWSTNPTYTPYTYPHPLISAPPPVTGANPTISVFAIGLQ